MHAEDVRLHPARVCKGRELPSSICYGSLGDETSWVKDGRADAILDNLYADGKPLPMIVVMPNANSAVFELDLLHDIIPYIEQHYPAKADRQHRGLAGVSAGATMPPPSRWLIRPYLPPSASSSAVCRTASGSRSSTRKCWRT